MDYRWAEWDLGHEALLMVIALVTFVAGTTPLAARRLWTAALLFSVTIVASILSTLIIMGANG
jgi:hypothetical protein